MVSFQKKRTARAVTLLILLAGFGPGSAPCLSTGRRQKLLQSFASRPCKYVGWRPQLLNPAVMQKHCAVRRVSGKGHFVCHDNHRSTFVGEFLHDAQNFANEFWIQR